MNWEFESLSPHRRYCSSVGGLNGPDKSGSDRLNVCLKRRNLDINQGWAGEPTVFASRPILMNRFFHYHKTFSLLILDNQDHSITSSSLVNTANVSDKKGTLKSIKGGLGWDCLSYRPTDSHESVPSLSGVVASTQVPSILGKGLVWILSWARHHSNNAPLV